MNNQQNKAKFNLDEYVTVNQRIEKFYQKYPTGRIVNDIVSIDQEAVIVKSTIYRDEQDIVAAQDFALEKFNSSFINKTSALENCSTSATGRALAMLGFEIKKSIASKEEVANAKLNQESNNSSYAQNKASQESKEAKVIHINKDQQVSLINLASQHGITKAAFEVMLRKKYNIGLDSLDVKTYNTIYNNLSNCHSNKKLS